MTHDKAKEFFSAYHEGTLDAGLRLSLEQKFASDSTLREEYQRFSRTLERLEDLKSTPIEIPFNLNDQISARLDRHLYEKKQAAPVAWYARLRNVAFAGVATVALVGAVLTYRARGSNSVNSGMIPVSSQTDQLQVVMKGDALTLEFSPSSRSTILIKTEPGDQPFTTIPVEKGASISRPLTNENTSTGLVSIEVADTPQSEHMVVAIPGSAVARDTKGNGSLEDFAKALAGRYHVPVLLSGVDPLSQVSWELSAGDARQAAETALKGSHLIVDLRDGSLVTIARG